ncbi:MAG TPA: UPF0182 family protein [Longimicrobiales bacterium]|nr:UPF0182 family protein [Longimicrobiales bacterium]
MSPRARRIVIGAVVLFLIVTIGGRIGVTLYTETLWFRELGYGGVYWTRLGATALMRLLAMLAGGVIVFANLWWVARGIGPVHVRRRYGNLEIAEQIPRRLVLVGVVLVSLLAGWWLAEVVFDSAASLHAYVWSRRPAWGVSDPLFGHDLSFYVFSLPLLRNALDFLLLLALWTTLLVAIGYVLMGVIRWEANRVLVHQGPLLHLASLGAALLLLGGAAWWLGRYDLLMQGSGIGGALGYTDVHARLPGRTAVLALSVLAAWGVMRGARRRSWLPPAFAVGVLAVGTVAFGQALPALLQKLRVEPNELSREAPYIRWNIDFTRQAYGLDDIRRESYRYAAAGAESAPSAAILDGLPRWDPEPLQAVYNQNQTTRGYYTFPSVDFDRYGPPGAQEQVAIAVREFTVAGLSEGARTWQTLHLNPQFVRGLGAVVTPAAGARATGEPVMWLGNLPVQRASDAPAELRLDNPSIFFGESMGDRVDYIVVQPGGDSVFAGQPGRDYPSGVSLGSPLRLLSFVWRFGEQNLLFSGELDEDSRIVFRRRLADRVRALAPFIMWDSDPLPVVHDGRIVWMVDGYTATGRYPLSRPLATESGSGLRYLRASIKATMDAVTGSTALYIVDDSDPLAEAYRRIFPSLLRPIVEMPEGLRRHLRYPPLYLNAQAAILEEYHIDDVGTFYAGQEVWEISKALGPGGQLTASHPSFVRVPLPPADEPEFLLMLPFIARERQNMTALIIARNDPPHYGELVLLELPVADQVPGPSQVQSAVEQDPIVSQTLTLWRREGSNVDLGQLRVVPTGTGFLYMQPLFLSAQSNPIPELRRIIVSDGRSVSMQPTLAEAVAGLGGAPAARTETPAIAAEEEPADVLPMEALELLDRAERRLRQGDWAGFGADLRELRLLLESWENP